jgi:hypothetical protein
MPRLALCDDFVADLISLQRPVQKEVNDAIQMFRSLTVPQLHASKGMHLEKLEGARDPRIRTIRITKFYRGVLLAPDDGSELYTLLRVAPHDEAIHWACKRAYSVNGATGGLEVRNVEALEQMETYFETKAVETPARLFARHSDTVLRDLGIDEQVLRLARVCVTEDDLTVMAPPMMPADQYEVLEYLAADYSPEDVWEQLIASRGQTVRTAEDRPAVTLSEAILNTPDRIVEVTGPGELERILTEDFTRWRVFLHPAQRRYAYHPGFNGPAQVTGGPGTGKTVVALHRVRHLLRTGREGDRILLTTFTNAMAAALRDSLALLLGEGDAHLLGRVDVTTVDSLAARVIREARGSSPKPLSAAAEKSAWTRAATREDLPWSERFLSQEFRGVVLAQGLRTPEEYLRCVRRGRGTQVGRVQRARISEQADDLFLVGDPHQRIYDSRVSLRSLGINVRGRTSRLRVNYRSTEEILRWSASLLDGQPVGRLGEDDDDDGGRDSLRGYRSELHGRVPVARGHAVQDDELRALVEQIRIWVDQDGVKPSEVAVCARFNTLVDAVIARLRREGVPAVAVKDAPGPNVSGVRVATMHAMKGLEFRCVAVVGVTSSVLPFAPQVTPADEDAVQHRSDLLAEHCLLFVACTRARDAVAISWSGERSRLLDPVAG